MWHKYNEPTISPGLTRVHQDIAIFGRAITQVKAADVRDPYDFAKNTSHMEQFYGQGGSSETAKRLMTNTERYHNPHREGKRCNDLWRIPVPHHGFNAHLRLHPNQKPDVLLERLIRLLSKEGDTILDSYMGSGTCGFNAVKLNRNFVGCELTENYFEVASKSINEANMQLHLTME